MAISEYKRWIEAGKSILEGPRRVNTGQLVDLVCVVSLFESERVSFACFPIVFCGHS